MLCHQENLRSYFEEAFPFCTIKDLRFAYDVEKLTSLHRELDNATKAKNFCEKHINAGKKPFYVHPVVCNRCCSCFCCGKKEEASSYYTNEKKLLEEKYEKQKDSALKTPLGEQHYS